MCSRIVTFTTCILYRASCDMYYYTTVIHITIVAHTKRPQLYFIYLFLSQCGFLIFSKSKIEFTSDQVILN